LGITILIKIRTDQQNETEEATELQTPTDPPANLNENSFDLQTSTPAPNETTNKPREKDATKCVHYFGYVSSGVKIPEECLTCSKLLKCLTSKDGIEEDEMEVET
jgi:hypothetical protein